MNSQNPKRGKTGCKTWRAHSLPLPTFWLRFVTVFAISALMFASVFAQNYSIDWHTVDNGGGTSASNDGRFVVTGTAGQPDAGQASSNDGRFQLNGGFWYGEFVFCGCTLSINYSGGSVTVSWPGDLNGCILEAADELRGPPSPIVWTPVSPQPTGHSYTVAITGTQRYFRLRSP